MEPEEDACCGYERSQTATKQPSEWLQSIDRLLGKQCLGQSSGFVKRWDPSRRGSEKTYI